MYTQEQFDKEYARYQNMPPEGLRIVKKFLHLRDGLSDRESARLKVVLSLIEENRREYHRVKSADRYKSKRKENVR